MLDLLVRLRALFDRIFQAGRKSASTAKIEVTRDSTVSIPPRPAALFAHSELNPPFPNDVPLIYGTDVDVVNRLRVGINSDNTGSDRPDDVEPIDAADVEEPANLSPGIASDPELRVPVSQRPDQVHLVSLQIEPEVTRGPTVEPTHIDIVVSEDVSDEIEPTGTLHDAQVSEPKIGRDVGGLMDPSDENREAYLGLTEDGLASTPVHVRTAQDLVEFDNCHLDRAALQNEVPNDSTSHEHSALAVLATSAGGQHLSLGSIDANDPDHAPADRVGISEAPLLDRGLINPPSESSASEPPVVADTPSGRDDFVAPTEATFMADGWPMDEADRARDAAEVSESFYDGATVDEVHSLKAPNEHYPVVEVPVFNLNPEAEDVDAEVQELSAALVAAKLTGTDLPAKAVVMHNRKPGDYRPRLNRARTRRAPVAGSSGGAEVQNLDVALQLLIGPGDWGVELWALLRVPNGAQDDVAVDFDGDEFWLGQLDEQLLEPLALPNATAAFGEPLLVAATGMPVNWKRTSRDLHVLSPDPRVAGFVSKPRVTIGQESVVICREALSQVALLQILATGSPEPVRIEGPNVPDGWICWRGVRPARPSLPVGGPGILDALDPLPAVSIEFSGGIKLSQTAWLEGYPPMIQLLGLLSEDDPVLFDGHEGTQDAEGVWTADRWDAAGQHRVEHGGVTANYAIEAGASDWDWWPAWRDAAALAGALSGPGGGRFFQAGASGTLIGARPGEICTFTSINGGVAMASPRFEPVWMLSGGVGIHRAIPAMIGRKVLPGASIGSADAVSRWARAIGASRRAGGDSGAERALWNRYLATARSLRKRRR